jgi:hypothetical protein
MANLSQVVASTLTSSRRILSNTASRLGPPTSSVSISEVDDNVLSQRSGAGPGFDLGLPIGFSLGVPRVNEKEALL